MIGEILLIITVSVMIIYGAIATLQDRRDFNKLLMETKPMDNIFSGSSETINPPKMYGWICPVCGRGLSPFTSVCPCQGEKNWTVTCTTGTEKPKYEYVSCTIWEDGVAMENKD